MGNKLEEKCFLNSLVILRLHIHSMKVIFPIKTICQHHYSSGNFGKCIYFYCVTICIIENEYNEILMIIDFVQATTIQETFSCSICSWDATLFLCRGKTTSLLALILPRNNNLSLVRLICREILTCIFYLQPLPKEL